MNTPSSLPNSKEGSWTRTGSATDECGNLAVRKSQEITVDDSIAPVINNCPSDNDVNLCMGVNLAAPPDQLSVMDACGSPAADLDCCFDSANDQSVRTWSVVDYCGNPASDCIQNVGIIGCGTA